MLFMSQRTLMSFIVLEGRRFDAYAIARIFSAGLAQVFAMHGCKTRDTDRIVDSYSELVLTKTANASITAQMNNLVRDYRHLVQRAGGLEYCDVGTLIRKLNQRPRKGLNWATPEEITREILFASAV